MAPTKSDIPPQIAKENAEENKSQPKLVSTSNVATLHQMKTGGSGLHRPMVPLKRKMPSTAPLLAKKKPVLIQSKAPTQAAGFLWGFSNNTTAAAVHQNNEPAVQKRYFQVLYTKPGTKKHKTSHDGILVVEHSNIGMSKVELQDMKGKKMTGSTVSAIQLSKIEVGNTLTLMSREIEIDREIQEKKVIDGTFQIEDARSQAQIVAKATSLSKKFISPLTRVNSAPAPTKKAESMYELRPDSVVLAKSGERSDIAFDMVLDPSMVRNLRPHQVEGVTFMWRAGLSSFSLQPHFFLPLRTTVKQDLAEVDKDIFTR